MTHIIKKGPIKVSTQPKDFDLQATGLVFKSYDNQIALEFNVAQQDGTPADLLGANLRLLMFIYDEVDGTIKKEPIPFITKNLITESFLNGHVVYILPEAMKAYNGMVEAYVYIEYPDGSTSDNLGFTFRMKRSAIDGLAQDKADYFIEDFKQLLAAASLEANKVIEGLDTEIKNLQQATKDANTAVDGAMDRIDGLEAEIGQLERLREMYIDTLDFEGYDYSGNPNIAPNVGFGDFYDNGSQTGYAAKDEVDHIAVTRTADAPAAGKLVDLRTLVPNKTYTISIDVWADREIPANGIESTLRLKEGTEVRTVQILSGKTVGTKRATYSTEFTTSSNFISSEESRVSFWFNSNAGECTCCLGYNIKVEEGSTATPYQPNLLDAPYHLSKVASGENIANKDVQFPIATTEYFVYSKTNIEDYKVNQKYVVTMKATKPSTQSFVAYLDWQGAIKAGDLTPVEGMADVWQLVFTVTQANIDAGAVRELNIYQYPSATKGACQIDWLKVEKGEVSTPLETPTYKGLGILDTDDPTKYVWSYTELVDVDGIQDALENVEQRTTTLEGKANTIDGRLNNVNTTLNTVQSTADQILAEVTAADVMKETDLPSYLANKPIVAGGMADFAGKVVQKVHPNPHKCANYALAYEHASQAPNVAVNFEAPQSGYNSLNKLDGSVLNSSTDTIGQTANLAFKFDLISQITKDFPSFFDDCPTQETKVAKIQKHIISATLTLNAKTTNTPLYVATALNNGWSAEKEYAATSQITEQKYAVLNYNSTTRSYIQNDGSIIFRARTRALDAAGTVQCQTDYARFDYTLGLSSDDFITPIERDVTKDNLTQILSDDSVMIKGAMDYKFKTRGNLGGCPHSAYLKSTSAQATNMSEITYEVDADVYSKIQSKDDGLASVLAPSDRGFVGQAKYKFDLVTAIEREHPHLFKGLTTTKQKVDVLKAKMQELKFNVWCRTEGASGYIEIGSSLSNVDAIDALQMKDVGQTTEFALATYHSENNAESAKRINDDGTILYFVHGTPADATYTAPKVITDYVNLEYTLNDKISEHVVKQNDAKYLDTVSKTTTATSDIAKIKTLIASMLQTETIKLDQNNTDFIRAGMIVMQRTMNTVTVYACFQTAKELTNGTKVYTPPVNFKPINSMGLVDGSYSGGADAQMYFDYENGGALTLNTTIPNEKWFTGGGTYTVDVVKLPQGF